MFGSSTMFSSWITLLEESSARHPTIELVIIIRAVISTSDLFIHCHLESRMYAIPYIILYNSLQSNAKQTFFY